MSLLMSLDKVWQYTQSTGELRLGADLRGIGYSGFGHGRNNSAFEAEEGVGPIPRGRYYIGPSYYHPHLGPCVMNLDPIAHTALGRTLFRIHGDNKTHDASHGCVILGPAVRQEISLSPTRELWVV